MGSNPTRSIFTNLVSYGIKSSPFSVIVGQTSRNALDKSDRKRSLFDEMFDIPTLYLLQLAFLCYSVYLTSSDSRIKFYFAVTRS